jgi:hypothetical protein
MITKMKVYRINNIPLIKPVKMFDLRIALTYAAINKSVAKAETKNAAL